MILHSKVLHHILPEHFPPLRPSPGLHFPLLTRQGSQGACPTETGFHAWSPLTGWASSLLHTNTASWTNTLMSCWKLTHSFFLLFLFINHWFNLWIRFRRLHLFVPRRFSFYFIIWFRTLKHFFRRTNLSRVFLFDFFVFLHWLRLFFHFFLLLVFFLYLLLFRFLCFRRFLETVDFLLIIILLFPFISFEFWCLFMNICDVVLLPEHSFCPIFSGWRRVL